MSKYLFTSDNKLYTCENGKKTELVSERVTKYRESLKSIQNSKKWKNSGTGAKFTGNYQDNVDYDEDGSFYNSINGTAVYNDKFVYSITLGEVSGLYMKSFDTEEIYENHIYASNNFRFGMPNVHGDKCAVTIGADGDKNLAVFELPNGNYTEITEGDSCEEYPCFSHDGKKIYFSTAGIARNQYGAPIARSAFAGAVYDMDRNNMDYILESEDFDYTHVCDDKDGNLYYIKHPYKTKDDDGIAFTDIIFFPFRLIKAIFGFLNIFAMLFGGEALNSKKKPRSDLMTKQMSEKDIILDGNKLNAEEIYKRNQKKNDKFAGIIPHSWELIKRSPDGTETCIKKGIMDFTLCENGDILLSNGRSVIKRSADGNEEFICDAKLACTIAEVD